MANNIVKTSAGDLIAPQAITIDLYEKFIAYLDVSPKSVETYTRAIRQFRNWSLENGILHPEREDILNYRDRLKESCKPSTVQNYIEAVKLFFRWTSQEGLYPNIAEHVKGAKVTREHKKGYLTSRQVKKVLATVDTSDVAGKRDYAILALMFTGGLRTIEVSRALVCDIQTIGENTVLYIQGKGREERTEYVKLAPQVEDAIRDYLAIRRQDNPKAALFTSLSNNNWGKALTTRTISGLVKKYLKAAGFNSEKLTAHSTRHTAVTLALLGGQSLQEAQQFARHANITTTQIYAHNLDRAQNQCESTIAKAIF